MLEQQEGNYNENRVVLSSTSRAEAQAMANEFGGTLRITKNGKFAVINLPEGMTLSDIAENDHYRKYHDRILLDYNNFSTADEDTADDTQIRSGYVIEDPMYAQQTYIDYLNIGGAWDMTQGANSNGEKVTVAIIDTGIDTDHPEFYDADGNSIISTQSYDATNEKVVDQYDISVIEDTHGHGTAVAGVIAAQMNEVGIAGIAPDVELLVIKCENDEAGEFRSSADIVFAIYYAIEMDVDVINMSLGGGGGEDMKKALQLAVDSDIICVAAAGNDSTDTPQYPAAYDTVIGVGALAEDSWEIAGYSNYAVNSDIMAPGTALTAAVGGEYTYQSGTSISAPMVSAAAALYKAQNKYVTYNQMKAELLAAGKDLGDPGEDLLYGFGALDINAFICEEKGIITYDYCTEEMETTTQVFVRSHTIQTVPEPERENIIFDDWYYDKSYTRVFDYDAWYSTEFVEDVTLYAKWVNEDDEDASVYNYRTLDDGTIEIVNYKGKRRYLTIPNEIDGKIVSSIGPGAFANNTRLREVTFPEGLVYIKSNAFAGVSKMREIIFTGVKLREIQNNAFYACSSLRKLNLPDSVSAIGYKAFDRCVAMTSVMISENSSLSTMGDFAFSGTAVNSFYIPKNVTAAGFNGSVLAGCSAMRAISVHSGNTAFTVSDSTLYNAEKTVIVYYPSALTGSYTVTDGVSAIGTYAFYGSSISDLALNSVIAIGDYSFASTRKLASVVLPDTVTSLGIGAFQYSSITQVTLSENIVDISKEAFSCSKLTGVHIPEGVQTIGASAFSSCRYLQTLTFADNAKLQSIGNSSFSSCGILTNFELPELLESIGHNAFSDCRTITSLTIPANVSSMGKSAFSGCSLLQYVDFADDCVLTQISDSCFAYCTSLHTVNFSDSIMLLGSSAFSNDRLLHNLNFSENSRLTTVGDSCFYACSALQTMQLPKSVTIIGGFAYAFSGLIRADIYANVSSIGIGAFGACYLLTEIAVDEDNTAYAAVDNVLFNKNISTVFCVPASRIGSYTLPETVKTTAPYSFYYDKFLTTVILPAGLEEIQMNSFYSCSSLAGIEIPANVTNIGRKAFENCWQMGVLTFESGSRLERLGIYTFVNCGVSEITIPASVEEIAQYVFYNCNNLRKVTFEENSALTYIAAYLFSGTRVDTVVFEEGSALTSLQAHAFDGATYLKTVDFGDAKITNVDNYAFYNCAKLEEVNIPDTVTYVGRYAFYGCAKLDRIDLPESVDYIGESAFVGTDSIRVFFAADNLPANVQTDWDKGISGYFLGVVDYVVTDEWEYSVRRDGTIDLSAYKGSASELTIDTVDGYTVSRIGARCFYNNDTLVSLTLSESVIEIGNYAFYDCDSLTAVIVPASVVKVGKYAFADSSISVSFADNSGLKIIDDYAFAGNVTASLVLPDSVMEIGDGAFLNSSLTVITISQSSGLETIGQQAFVGSGITEIYLPASMKTVGAEAFKNVISLTNVEIAAGDVGLKLSNGAFEGSGITGISIPARVWYIGEYTLGSCRNLQNIRVDSANTAYTSLDGVLCDIGGTTLIQYPCGRSGAYEVPAHIKVLTYSSFRDAKNLTEVTFAEGSTVRTIGWKTFSGCESLTKITVPDTVVSFDFYAFENCTALTDVILGECTQITGVYEGAFYNCTALANIMLPDTVVEISDYTFYNCAALTEFPLSESSQVKGIYDYAFYGCSGITEIPALQQLAEIGNYAFAYTNIEELSIGAAVKDVASNAFIGCERFATIHCDEANEEYAAIDGALYEKGSTDAFDFETLIIWPENKAYVIGSGVSCLRKSDTYILDTISAPYIKVADTVTEISSHAFSYFRKLRKVEIPDSVTTIGSYAFHGCVELKEVILPESITTIGYSVFGGCVTLQEISVPNSVTTIGPYAFSGCVTLQEISVPNSVTTIGPYAFSGCVALQEMHLPEGEVQIQENAFMNCKGLKRLVIPESVTQIGDYAFDGCTALEEVYYNAVNLPDFEADSNVFRNVAKNNECGAKVIVGANVTRIPAYLFCSELAWAGYDTQNIYSVTFEEGSICTEIGQYAFAENHGLTYCDLPECLLTISTYAFDDCEKLISLMIPTSVTSIGDFAFSGCHSLTVMHQAKKYPKEGASSPAASICENVRSYGITENGQFYCVTNDDTVIVSKYHGSDPILTIPAEIEGYPVTTIAKCAFEGNETATVVVISEGITEIRYHAFSVRDQLLAVLIPESVTVADTAFSGKRLVLMLPGDTYLGSDSLPSNAVANVTEWGFSEEQFLYFVTKDGIAVAGAYLGEESAVEIPDQIHGIPVTSTLKTFAGRPDVKQVYIPDTITEIGQATFLECEGLTEVEIPDSVQSIGTSAFNGCRSLESVTLPNQITAISSNTFAYCSNLRDISIPDTVLSIGGSSFYRCHSLERITIPDQVTAIGASAFEQCTNLKEVTIGKNVTTIGKEAFYECTMLNRLDFHAAAVTECVTQDTFAHAGTASDGIHVYFGNGVTRIPDQLFYTPDASDAPKIIEVVFEEGCSCTYIGLRAFQNIPALKKISIPDSVTTIGNYAFEGCNNLVIMVEGTELPAALGTSWNGSCPVCVNVKAAGRTDYGQLYWVNQDDTVTLSQYAGSATELLIPGWVDGYPVTEIANSAFTGCTDLVSVTLPDTVTRIGDAAFNGCTALTSVNIPDGVASIGATAFNGCTSLREVEIPDTVTQIGQKAFYGCTGLNLIFRGETLPKNLGKDWYVGACVCTDVSRIGHTDLNLSYYVTNSGSIVIGKYYGSATNCVIPEQIEGMPVTSIAASAFYNRSDLRTVNIPRQVVSIGNYAFYGCTKLTHIQIDAIALEDLAYGNYSFNSAGKNSSSLTVTFGNEVSRIPGYLFYPDDWEASYARVHITDVVFEEGSVCQSIGNYAFRECYKLKNICIPDTVTSIGVRAFFSCNAVSGFWIPSGVTNVSASAFTGCRMLMFEADTLPDGYSLAAADKTTVILGAVSYGTTDDGFFYCISKDGYAVVGNYTGSASDVKIPEKIEEATVTGIACRTFFLSDIVTDVHIPDTVTFIGAEAFSSCKKIVSLEIPDSVCSIGQKAFSSCNNLTSITLSSGLEEIPEQMAYFSQKLANVTIPDGIKKIGSSAFGYCNGIKCIVIPESVEQIGNYAFQSCNRLVLVQINSPEIAKSITSGTSAGYLCNVAKTVIIPAEITEIGSYVTTKYTAIEDTTVNGMPYLAYSNHVHGWEEQSSTEWIECVQDGETTYLCSVCAMEKVVVEPAHKLGDWTVVTESSCTEAGDERRDCINCDFHETREIPASGHSYEHIVAAPTCTEQGYTTHTCTACGDSYMDTYMDALGHSFEQWQTTKEPSCTENGENQRACSTCGEVEAEVISATGHSYESVVTDPTCTEQGCTTHTCSACGYSYADTYVEALGHTPSENVVENNVDATCAADGSYDNVVYCSVCKAELSREEVVVPSTGNHSYKSEVTAPTCTEKGYTTHICIVCEHSLVDTYTDALGHDYESVVTQPTEESCGYTTYTCSLCGFCYTGDYCIIGNVTADGSCGDSVVWLLDDMGTLWICGIGVMDNWSSSSLVPWSSYNSTIVAVRIHNGVENIGNYAFYSCSKLSSIVISESVDNIGNYAFLGCTSLISIDLPESVASIGNDAFYDCTGLSGIAIPEGVTSIGSNAFRGCTGLTQIIIPSSVTSLGTAAFFNCTRLNKIMFYATEMDDLYWSNTVFYKAGTKGSGITLTVGANVKKIPAYLFNPYDTSSYAPKITNVVFEEGSICEEIGASAFACCDKLKFITFTGNAPTFGNSYVFGSVTATVYYPVDNETWTKDVMQNYGGTLTWIPMCMEHTWEEWTVVKEATCSEAGEKQRTCSACGEAEMEVIPATGHSYETVVTAPTCTEEGFTVYTCSVCGDSYVTDYISPEGHSYEAVITSPTCTEQGYTAHTCSVCGDSYRDTYVDALGHTLGDWYTVTVAACEEDGEEHRDCERCEHFESRMIPALGHTWDEGVVTVEATEESEGEMLYTCETCGKTRTEVIPTLEHVHSYETSVTDPTCTEEGYTTYTCRCGDSYTDDIVVALGHDMSSWTVVMVATCTENGEEQRSCSRCEHKETQVIPAIGHAYESAVTEPTCSAQGYTTHTCTACGDSYADSYTEVLGHSFTQYVSDGNATCTQNGTMTAKCDRCDATDTVTEAGTATGHSYEAVVTDPGCTKEGFTVHTCSACGDSYVDSYVDALGHKPGDPVEENRIEAACETDGSCDEVVYCSVCGEELSRETVTISAVGHSFCDWETTNAPTCTENGEKQRICAVCGEVEREELPAEGHSYEAVVIAPTCTEQGYTTFTCRCGDSYVNAYVEAQGHIPGETVEENKVEAACEAEGSFEEVVYCSVCGEELAREKVTTPATGHTEVMDAAVAATCISDGLTEGKHCSVCHEILLTQEVVPALGHHFESGTCTNCGIKENAEGPQIVSQPVDYVGLVGDMASFTVVAEGESLRYQWYFYDINASRWKKSSDNTSATMRVEFKAYRNNQQYRCEITDAAGNTVTSNTVKLTAKVMDLVIVTQPVSYVGSVNDDVSFVVEATGNGLTYRWYYSTDGGATWNKSGSPGFVTANLQPILRAYRDGYKFYCTVTDIFGNTVNSDVVSMDVKSSEVIITKQPEDVNGAKLGNMYYFETAATGDNLVYRWEFSSDGGETWQLSWNQGYNTATLGVRMNSNRDGYLYRCQITSGLKTVVYTEPVSLDMQEPSAQIASQSGNVAVIVNKTATFTVYAEGTDLTYLWYRSNDKGATWNQTFLSGYNTDTLSFVATNARAAMYMCKVTDGSGKVVWSEPVKLQILSAELKILTQPENVTCVSGAIASFTVETQGDTLKYQWYASSDGGETWIPSYLSGYNTATFSFTVNATRAAKLYKCVITDAGGNTVETNTVSVTIG